MGAIVTAMLLSDDDEDIQTSKITDDLTVKNEPLKPEISKNIAVKQTVINDNNNGVDKDKNIESISTKSELTDNDKKERLRQVMSELGKKSANKRWGKRLD